MGDCNENNTCIGKNKSFECDPGSACHCLIIIHGEKGPAVVKNKNTGQNNSATGLSPSSMNKEGDDKSTQCDFVSGPSRDGPDGPGPGPVITIRETVITIL